MGKKDIKISLGIIVLNYNSFDDTVRCITEILGQVRPIDIILILDNNSSDYSGDNLSKRFKDEEQIEYIKNEKNLGYAKGNNVGIKYLVNQGYDLILVCNPDIIIQKNALEVLRYTIINKDASVIGPKIIQPDGFVAIDCAKNRLGLKEKFFITTPFRIFDFFGIRKKYYYNYDYSYTKEVFMLSGSFMMFRKEVIVDIGGFDESTFLYEEEPIIFEKVSRLTTSKVLFCPDAVVLHNHPKGLKSNSLRKFYIESEQYYLKEYLGAGYLIRSFFYFIRTLKSVFRPN